MLPLILECLPRVASVFAAFIPHLSCRSGSGEKRHVFFVS